MNNPWKQYSNLNPQRENGNRQIASDVFKSLMSANLSGAEFRIVMTIIDKTWGFNKESDCISCTQFSELTGLAERTIKESIKTLKSKRVIFYAPSSIRGRCGSPFNEFLFNKHYDTWKTQGCKNVHGCIKPSNKGEQKRKTRVSNPAHTKETITKENTKERECDFLLPENIKKETWEAYLEMRKTIKKPATLHAQNLIIKKLLKMEDDPNLILEQSIENSYQGVFPLKTGGTSGTNTNRGNRNQKVYSEQDRIADEINAEYYRRKAAEASDNPTGNT